MMHELSDDAQAFFDAESREAAKWYRDRSADVERLRAELASEQASAMLHAGLLREVAIAMGLNPGDDRSALPALVSALRKGSERYRWLRDHPLWSVGYRIKPRSTHKEWRMRNEGDYWGPWWPTHEQAVDHAMARSAE